MTCLGLDTSAWTSPVVSVSIGGQDLALPQGFEYVQEPSVLSAVPAVGLMQAGGQRIEVIGSGFGKNISDVANVTIGAHLCTDVTLESDSVLHCTAPAQIGQGLDLVITNALGRKSDAQPLISYAGPVIERLSPEYEF